MLGEGGRGIGLREFPRVYWPVRVGVPQDRLFFGVSEVRVWSREV